MVIGMKPEKIEEYKALHADSNPGVRDLLSAANMRNFSIYLKKFDDGKYYLFGYYEYVGDDFEADMARMAADPETQRWWDWMMPMQRPLENRAEGEWWHEIEEVFHLD